MLWFIRESHLNMLKKWGKPIWIQLCFHITRNQCLFARYSYGFSQIYSSQDGTVLLCFLTTPQLIMVLFRKETLMTTVSWNSEKMTSTCKIFLATPCILVRNKFYQLIQENPDLHVYHTYFYCQKCVIPKLVSFKTWLVDHLTIISQKMIIFEGQLVLADYPT